MTLLVPQAISIDGLVPNFVAASAGGDSCAPGDQTFVRAINSTGAAVTITVAVPGSEYGVARADIPVTVPANGEAAFGPLVTDLADPTTHDVSWTYSASAGITVGAFTI